MKKLNFLTLLFLISGYMFAQIPGSITPELLEKIKKSYNTHDAETKAIHNDIKKLVETDAPKINVDHNFKYKVSVKGITDQKSSGRCWMFTGLNVMRPKVLANANIDGFEFSTNYLYFWDQFEKANLFLEGIIATSDKSIDDRTVVWLFENAIGDGGVWNLFVDLINKYGTVPKDVMPESQSSENTGAIQSLIKRKLREDGIILRDMYAAKNDKKKIQDKKIEMLSEIYRILAISLGEPPTEFNWRYVDKDNKITELKKYTPKSFYDEYVKVNLSDYVLLMDDPTREYYKLYEIEYDRNMYEGTNWRFINLPSTEIKEFARKSIIDNEAMYFSCDVGKQLNSTEGYLALDNYDFESLFGVKFGMDKKQRIQTRESGSSHGMALVGVDEDANGKITKWQLENSWGGQSGHNGYLTMTDEWFDQYMFRIVVNKKYVDAKILDYLNLKPIKLPPWDPMFMMEE